VRVLTRLSRRIVLVSLFFGGVVAAIELMPKLPVGLERAIISRWIPPHSVDDVEQRRCELAPATWMLARPPWMKIYAYDETTLKSLNVAAPGLWHPLYAGLNPGIGQSAILHTKLDGLGTRSTYLVRVADSGPCGLTQAIWEPPRGVRLAAATLEAVIFSALIAALGLLVLLRPLLVRIEHLRKASARVGATQGYVAVDDGLRDELSEVGTSLTRAHERVRADTIRLEARHQALEQYVSDVVHDLRTPIASLQLSLELAADATRDPVVAKLLSRALIDAVYQDALVRNLRIACRLRDGWNLQADDAKVDLTHTLEQVVARERVLARRRGIALEMAYPDGPVYARCDPVAAEQALGNVVRNAVAYGDRGGHVSVLLTATAARAFSVVVVDDGPGVPPEDLPRLRERTFRSDEARQRDPMGSGLGLAITSEVCSRCRWQLAFAPNEPHGLRVVITGEALASETGQTRAAAGR
jgi:signal transduction histidine kinase